MFLGRGLGPNIRGRLWDTMTEKVNQVGYGFEIGMVIVQYYLEKCVSVIIDFICCL